MELQQKVTLGRILVRGFNDPVDAVEYAKPTNAGPRKKMVDVLKTCARLYLHQYVCIYGGCPSPDQYEP